MTSVVNTGSTESRALGVGLILGSAVFFALAGIFTKAIASDLWTISSWRSLVGGAIIMAYVLWRGRGRPLKGSLSLGWRGALLALTSALASLSLVASFKHTYVSNVVFIAATVPFVTAVIAWLAIRESARMRTLVAAGFSLIGVAIVVYGGLGSGNLLGDAFAVALTVLCAFYMVMVRAFRSTPVVWAAGVSALSVFVVTLPLAEPTALFGDDGLLIVLFGISFAMSLILWTEGTRHIPASEAGLIGCAELPLAVLFAGLLLAEWPPMATAIGGAVVLIAVLAHAGLDLAQSRAAAARARKPRVAG